MPDSAEAFFPCRLTGPDDHFQASPDWISEIKKVAEANCPVPDKPKFRFSTEKDDIKHNAALLKKHNCNMAEVLKEQKGSTVWHGSEFRPVSQLAKTTGDHPTFECLAETLTQGVDHWFKDDISREELVEEREAQLKKGNHESATKNETELKKMPGKEVKCGFSLPFEPSETEHADGAEVQPVGKVSQFSLSKGGTRSLKDRMTRDLSHCISKKRISVNDQVDVKCHPEMVCGWRLLRIIHFVVCLRCMHPQLRICIAKFDCSDACRRTSRTASAAIKPMSVMAGVACMALRLAFRGSPNPACFCTFSETLTDVASELS